MDGSPATTTVPGGGYDPSILRNHLDCAAGELEGGLFVAGQGTSSPCGPATRAPSLQAESPGEQGTMRMTENKRPDPEKVDMEQVRGRRERDPDAEDNGEPPPEEERWLSDDFG